MYDFIMQTIYGHCIKIGDEKNHSQSHHPEISTADTLIYSLSDFSTHNISMLQIRSYCTCDF